MLAMAINDPAFGILYVSVIAVLTAALVLGSELPLGWKRIVTLVGAVVLGFFVGSAVTGAYRDVSGAAPVTIARPAEVAPLPPRGRMPPPKAGAPAGEISVDVFQRESGEGPRAAERLVVKAGDSIRIEGWAYDVGANAPCGAVDVAVDGKPAERIRYGISRSDVSAFYKDSDHLETGFAGSLSTRGLRPGDHQVSIRCIAVATNVAHPGLQRHEVTVTK